MLKKSKFNENLIFPDSSGLNEGLKKALEKLNGRGFGAFFSHEIDKIVKNVFAKLKEDYFAEFALNDDDVPLCALGLSNYGLNEIGYNCELQILLLYKDLRGFNARDLAVAYEERLKAKSPNFKIQIQEISTAFNSFKDDMQAKSNIASLRYICASKILYKQAKEIFNALKAYKKDEFISYHLNALKPYDDVLLLSQKPDLKSGYGGFFDYERALMLLSLDGKASTNALKYISEKEYSELVLASEFLSSLMSALRLSGGNDSIDARFLAPAAKLLKIKEKRDLDTQILLVAKTLTAMQKIAVYSRYLLRVAFYRYFSSNLSFKQLRASKRAGHFYLINETIYTPLHAKSPDLLNILEHISTLPDLAFKFHIESILYIKNAQASKTSLENAIPIFKKLFFRKNAFWILKALLDGEQLFSLVKPMEHTRHLAQFNNYKYSVDEYSLVCVYELENITDGYFAKLFESLSEQNKALLKLTALMHEVAKGQSSDDSKHAIMGANIFRAYMNKLDFNGSCVNLGVNLVKNHSLMNKAINEGINAQSVLSLISHIEGKTALKMLCVLTYAIIKTQNDSTHIGIKISSLKDLYEKALASFKNTDHSVLGSARLRAKKEILIKKQDEFVSYDKSTQDKILSIKSTLLFIFYPASEILKIASWAICCANIDLKVKSDDGFCAELIVRRGWNLTLVLSELARYDLAYMEAFELFDNKFFIKLKYTKQVSQNELKSLHSKLIGALCDKNEAKIKAVKILENELKINASYLENIAKIGINAKDAQGFMAFVLSILDKCDFKLSDARIQTIKNRTRNVFLVHKDKDFDKKIAQFKEYLINE